MLPRPYRLKRMKEFSLLFEKGRFVFGQVVGVKIYQPPLLDSALPNSLEHVSRIGFAVGVKIAKGAVRRNRIKRQIREVVRLLIKEGRVSPGYLVLVVVKKEVVGVDFDTLKRDLLQVFSRAGLLIDRV